MKKLYNLLIIILFFSAGAQAQNNYFTGKVVDSTGVALDMVSVALLSPSDSSLESFTVTNPDGTFQTDRLSNGNYILQVSFLGYSTHAENVTVGPDGTPSDRGIIRLVSQLNVLSEVVINGQRIPVLINKDTVEYDASAFRVRADDNVEDLLKRLPGIDVDRDGTITAQGREVEEVLVDGKEFFGGDPAVATRNIPADAVKSVQVYDRQSDDAKFTGVDDGERSKTINLELKEDRKTGYFGYVEGGAGAADNITPFMAKGGLHRFSSTTRVSVLGNMNNVNDYGFSFGDYRDMAGASSSGGGYMITFTGDETIPLNWGGPNDGQYVSGATGVNLNWDPNSNHRFNSSYFFTHLDNFTSTTENSRSFLGDETILGRRESEDNSISNNHAFSISHRSDLDSMNRVELSGSGRYRVGRSNSSTYETRALESQGLLQESNRSASSDDNQVSGNFDLTYTHKFSTNGRILQLSGGLDLSDNESDGEWKNDNAFPLDNTVDSLYQQRRDNNNTTTASGQVRYVEPLVKNHYLEASVSMANTEQRLLRETYDLYSGGFQDIYSPDFQLSENNQSGALNYRYTGEKHNLNIGARGVRYTQSAVEQRFETTIPEREYYYFLPSIDYNWNISTFSRAGVNYSTTAELPELTQLLTLQDITNPLVKFVGNPDLTPQFRHRVWAHYGSWNSFEGSGFFANISGSLANNVIGTDQTIDSQYVRILTPQNFSTPSWRVNGGVNYRFTVNSLGTSVRTGLDGSYNNMPGSINGQENIQDNYSVGGRLGFRNTNQEKYGIEVGGNATYNWSTYSLQTQLNQEYLSHNYYLNLDWTPTDRFGVETGMNLQNYSNASFADDQFVPIWNANVRYNFSADGTAQLQLTVFDILNQNRGISRYGNLNAITEVQTNSLGRYVMVSFLYKFNSASNSGSGGNTVREERVTIRQ